MLRLSTKSGLFVPKCELEMPVGYILARNRTKELEGEVRLTLAQDTAG